MFMTKENNHQQDRLKKIYKKVKVLYGEVPPQMKCLGDIDADYLEDFLLSISRIARHKHIDPDFFGFIRLYVAYREDYPYCKSFNTKLLLSRGFEQSKLDSAITDIKEIPFDEKHKALGAFAIKAMYESAKCVQDDLDRLFEMGWSQKDIFDAVEHAGAILKNGRILTAFGVKSS